MTVLSIQYQIEQIEYQVRKKERGIRVLYIQGAKSEEVLRYAEGWEELLDELERLTGRREPTSPRWPV